MPRPLALLQLLQRTGRSTQGTGGALAGAARAQRRPQFLGLGLVAILRQGLGLGLGGGDQLLGRRVGTRRARCVTGQPQGALPAAPGLPVGRQPASTTDVGRLSTYRMHSGALTVFDFRTLPLPRLFIPSTPMPSLTSSGRTRRSKLR